MADSEVPYALVERFAKASADFVAAIKDALAEAALDPQMANTPDFRRWKSKALPLLQTEDASIQATLARFKQGEGDVRSILTLAEDKRGLAKDLDGFSLDFAGLDHAGKLDSLETALVSAACRLCAAAGIP